VKIDSDNLSAAIFSYLPFCCLYLENFILFILFMVIVRLYWLKILFMTVI